MCFFIMTRKPHSFVFNAKLVCELVQNTVFLLFRTIYIYIVWFLKRTESIHTINKCVKVHCSLSMSKSLFRHSLGGEDKKQH